VYYLHVKNDWMYWAGFGKTTKTKLVPLLIFITVFQAFFIRELRLIA
jgi:hypothetical protein